MHTQQFFDVYVNTITVGVTAGALPDVPCSGLIFTNAETHTGNTVIYLGRASTITAGPVNTYCLHAGETVEIPYSGNLNTWYAIGSGASALGIVVLK
jgi:hypothetical protein